MDKFFKISERGSNVKTEIIAGLTTFFAMAYIIVVNPNQIVGFSFGVEGIDKIWNAVYIASIIAAVIGTLLYAFYANLPFAQACGMGLNSFFFVSFVLPQIVRGGDTIEGYRAGLVLILISGLIFLVLSLTGAREMLAKAMPECIKKSISAGIGLFIAFLGFQNVGIITDNEYTLVQFVKINGAKWEDIAPAMIALLGFLIIVVLTKLNVKGAVLISIIATSVIWYVATWQLPDLDMQNFGQSFKDFGEIGITAVFDPESWKNAFSPEFTGGVFSAIMLVVTFCIVDMFDTVGTLYGAAAEANMLDDNGDPIAIDKAMTCDSVATVAGAVCGTSTCTTFVECASGVAAGGRTGLASVVTSICFAICLFLAPFASIIPAAATAPALIYVGVLMLKNFSKVDMTDLRSAVPAFLTLIMMPLTYSIANGIGIGCISYVLITLFTGKYTKKDLGVTIIALLFLCKFIFGTI
ncbi:MAG: NCS2 family permease [Clostridia bacterium]|nr:NCS2 family permease [Clostridia bacterium]